MIYPFTTVKVSHKPNTIIPVIGDKVTVTKFDLLPNHVVRKITQKNDVIEVTDVTPVPIGENGVYYWEYEIDAIELDGYLLGINNYKINR